MIQAVNGGNARTPAGLFQRRMKMNEAYTVYITEKK